MSKAMQNLATIILSKVGRALGLALFAIYAMAQSPSPATTPEAPQQQQPTAPTTTTTGNAAAQQTQTPENQPPATPPDAATTGQDQVATFKIGSNEVNVVFTVTDKHGRHITNLKQEDFRVVDDSKPPEEIRSFHSETNLPLQVGLLMA